MALYINGNKVFNSLVIDGKDEVDFIPQFSETVLVSNPSANSSFTFSEDYHNYDFVQVKIHNSSSSVDTYIVTTASTIDAIFDISPYINFNEFGNNQWCAYSRSSLTWTRKGQRNCDVVEILGLNCTNAAVTETQIYKSAAQSGSTDITTTLNLMGFDWILFSSTDSNSDELQPCNNIFQGFKGVSDTDIDKLQFPFNPYNESYVISISNHYISSGPYSYVVGINFVKHKSINPLDVDTTHPVSCARVGATDLSKEIASFTTTTNGNITISVTGLTDCGSNEAYVALLINGVEKERGTLTTDVSTTVNFQTISTIADETISLKFGWANNHTASFSGTYTCKSVGVPIPAIKVHSGKVNLATGAIVDDADYCYTDFIDFSNGYQLFDFGETAGAYVGCCWYKEDGTYGGNYWSANARFRYVDNSSYYSNGVRKQRLTFRRVMLEKVIFFDNVTNKTYTFNPIKLEE